MGRTRRTKKRTHVGQQAAQEQGGKTVPHTFVMERGRVGRTLAQLVLDLRRVMEPHTAAKLKVRHRNVLMDFVNVAGPLGVTHFMIVSRSATHVNLRVCRLPRGPTITFHITNVSVEGELGPRLTLQLVKVEAGLCNGEVLYHEFIHKTKKEARAVRRRVADREQLRSERRRQQEENVARKKREKEQHKQRCLEGQAAKKREKEMDNESESEAEDDREWYRQEVGEEPDPDVLGQMGPRKRRRSGGSGGSVRPGKRQRVTGNRERKKPQRRLGGGGGGEGVMQGKRGRVDRRKTLNPKFASKKSAGWTGSRMRTGKRKN